MKRKDTAAACVDGVPPPRRLDGAQPSLAVAAAAADRDARRSYVRACVRCPVCVRVKVDGRKNCAGARARVRIFVRGVRTRTGHETIIVAV